MSATQDDGGPVSATLVVKNGDPITPEGGLSIRDWFAGLALQGGLSSTETLQQAALVVLRADGKITLEQMLAIRSYAFADAMLAARKGEQP